MIIFLADPGLELKKLAEFLVTPLGFGIRAEKFSLFCVVSVMFSSFCFNLFVERLSFNASLLPFFLCKFSSPVPIICVLRVLDIELHVLAGAKNQRYQ